MRQFAAVVGISNPYMSQIERGLRDPSEAVLEAIAHNLDLSVDALYEQAGLTDAPDDYDQAAVRVAIREDPRLSSRQRQALLEVYDAFVGADAPCTPAPSHQGPRWIQRSFAPRRRRSADGGADAT